MKTKILGVGICVLFVLSALVMKMNRIGISESGLLLANVDALAQGEIGTMDCLYYGCQYNWEYNCDVYVYWEYKGRCEKYWGGK